MPSPEIAIIDPNTLSSLGLCGLLEELIPGAVIRMFPSFAAFADDTPDMYAHYFVSAQVYLSIRFSSCRGAPKPLCWQRAKATRNWPAC